MKLKLILQIAFLNLIFTSCKDEVYKSTVVGKVINSETGAPIQGAYVKISDGTTVDNWLISSNNKPSVSDIDTTNSQGEFILNIQSESKAVDFVAYKKGYEFQTDGVFGFTSFGTGIKNITAKLQGIGYFNSPFKKSSSLADDKDSLKIKLLSYNDINQTYYWYDKNYKGKGPFLITFEDKTVKVIGDRYLRYKLEWTTDGVWYNKIDSVYLPTSPEVYKEPIYY